MNLFIFLFIYCTLGLMLFGAIKKPNGGWQFRFASVAAISACSFSFWLNGDLVWWEALMLVALSPCCLGPQGHAPFRNPRCHYPPVFIPFRASRFLTHSAFKSTCPSMVK